MLFSFCFLSVGREMEEIFKLHVFAQVSLVVGYDIFIYVNMFLYEDRFICV